MTTRILAALTLALLAACVDPADPELPAPVPVNPGPIDCPRETPLSECFP